jgi:beta-N-acetylhexosaminidase
MEYLARAPFNLSARDLAWVRDTLAGMSEDEKIRQLFCLVIYGDDDASLAAMTAFAPGGIMTRPMPLAEGLRVIGRLQSGAKIPLLVAANLEKGGNGAVTEGTFLGSPMEVAASGDPETARRLGAVCGDEGAAAGCSWSFAPIIDIDYNFRNPITNTRTFGSDPARVAAMGVEYVKSVQERGLAASIKHFPGDGRDERDQHLVVSVNDLSCEEWDRTYGAIYKACIDAGAMTVMVGHIQLPSYSRALVPGIADRDIMPGSLSKELVSGLLRGKLGFNGLVVTDATTMAGMMIPKPRAEAVPLAIAAGCDMFLFTRSMEEDLGYMRNGLRDGVMSSRRLDDAVTRILGLKASLGLHDKAAKGSLVPDPATAAAAIGSERHKAWAAECADRAITLVKEEMGILPLDPSKKKRVIFYPIESGEGFAYSVRVGAAERFRQMLAAEGFEIDVFQPKPGFEGMMQRSTDLTDRYDLAIYLANLGTKSNQTTVRIEWAQPMGANVPMFVESLPTIFISVENPYHLLDAPRVKTYINAYASTDTVLKAIVDKLVGRSSFKGINPVDPFCGRWDTHL